MTTSQDRRDAGENTRQEERPVVDDHTPTILVIDDQIASLELVLDHLATAGLTILSAQDGISGIARANYAQPDLILLDGVMPGIDGFETCRRLKAAEVTREIPVIFMTTLDDLTDKVRGFAVGGVDYVTKPVQVAEVLARVQTHVALRVLQRQRAAHIVQLQQEIAERKRVEAEREQLILELQAALANIKTLRGLLPICAWCKQIRDDTGYWNQLESYLLRHTEAEFSHGICPACVQRLYPDLYEELGSA